MRIGEIVKEAKATTALAKETKRIAMETKRTAEEAETLAWEGEWEEAEEKMRRAVGVAWNAQVLAEEAEGLEEWAAREEWEKLATDEERAKAKAAAAGEAVWSSSMRMKERLTGFEERLRCMRDEAEQSALVRLAEALERLLPAAEALKRTIERFFRLGEEV